MNRRRVIPCAFVLLALVCPAITAASWPMSRGGPLGTGAGGGSGAIGQVAWTFADGPMEGEPIIGPDGTVYLATQAGVVYAVDGATGLLRWRSTWAPAMASPALTPNGLLLVITVKGVMRAYEAATGNVRWERNVAAAGHGQAGSPIVVGDGPSAYVASGDKTVTALDATTGAVKWVARPGVAGVSLIRLAADGGIHCLTADMDAALVALHPATGAEQSRTPLGTGPTMLFALTPNGSRLTVSMAGVQKFTTASGTTLWQKEAKGVWIVMPAIHGDRYYRVSPGGFVEAISMTNGATVWTQAIGPKSGRGGVTVDGAGRVYASTSDGLVALDPANGGVVWRMTGPASTRPIAVGPNGWLYYTSGGKLVAVK